MTLPKPKKRNEKTLQRKADTLHSWVVRQGAADFQGYITCYCGTRVRWQDSDCSHYISRRFLVLRYDYRNTTPSCHRCNRFLDGNLADYGVYLEQKYGHGILQTLQKEKQKIIKHFDYEFIIKARQAELDQIQNEKMQTM